MHTSRYILVIFSPSSHHSNLHSFPTRRSSDLATREIVIQAEAGQRRGALGQRIALGNGLLGQVARTGNMATRSEEHTSELQSLRHLVCRLLLEKKKKTT